MRSPPLRRETTCEKHDLVQSGKSSLKSWPDVKLIPQTNKQTPEKPQWSQKKPLVILEMCKNKKNETNPCTFKNEYGALKDRYRDHIPIFTDGSKEGNKVGYAVHTEYGDLTGALHGRASIFTAEARALTRALDWIKVSGHRKFIIFSDSKSCLQAMLQHQPTNREGAKNSGGNIAGLVPAIGNTGKPPVPASAGTSESDHSGT